MRTLETPEFIYFDLGKVLLDFSHDAMLAQMGQLIGLEPSKVREFVFESGLSHQYERGEIDCDQFCSSLCQAAGAECEPEELLKAGSDIFSLKPGMLPLIVNLSLSGMRVGILSNTCPAHWNFIRSRYRFVSDFFLPIVLSFEIGAMKPDRKIFDAAATQAGVAPESIFFVDDLQDNVDGALSAGWDANLFESPYQLQQLLLQRGVELNY